MLRQSRKILGRQVKVVNKTQNTVQEGRTTWNAFDYIIDDDGCFEVHEKITQKSGKVTRSLYYGENRFSSEKSLVKYLTQ